MAENNKIMTTSGEITLTNDVVRKYLVNGGGNVTDQEVTLFIGLCKANKLNPFNKDAYLIKYGSQPATIVTSKDIFFKRAIDNPDYDGMESGLILEKDGEIINRKGSIYIKDKEKILGAWCKVYRKNWQYPMYQEVNFTEYAGYKKDTGELNAQWKSKPAVMILKVAESTALRKTFTDSLQGLYIEEEFSNNIDNASYEVIEEKPTEIKDILEE